MDPISLKEKLGYDPRIETEILQRARALVGKSIKDILASSPFLISKFKKINKGKLGNIIQHHWFGLPDNPSPEPDFVDAGIELKIIPLTRSSKGELKVKERTKVCNIDYCKLVQERWDSSHAKKKLKKILFIYYTYDVQDHFRSKVDHIEIWELVGPTAQIIQDDWTDVQKRVKDGYAHLLSESYSKIPAASRTGQGRGRDLVPQPSNTILAQRRAFSLKQSFTQQRWRELFTGTKYESVIQSLGVKDPRDFERRVLERLRSLEGMTLGELSRRFNILISKGKNSAATIMKKALGFKNVNSKIKEFEQFGISIKVVPVRGRDQRPWESVSLPTFKLQELEEETWEEASIWEDISRILFVPIYEDMHPGTEVSKRIVGRAFFWSPDETQWKVIEKEWKKYRDDIKAGKARITKVPWGSGYREVTGLMKGSKTKVIHVRPHGQDRNDKDVDSHGNRVVKQSFWLNKQFVQELIRQSLIKNEIE